MIAKISRPLDALVKIANLDFHANANPATRSEALSATLRELLQSFLRHQQHADVYCNGNQSYIDEIASLSEQDLRLMFIDVSGLLHLMTVHWLESAKMPWKAGDGFISSEAFTTFHPTTIELAFMSGRDEDGPSTNGSFGVRGKIPDVVALLARLVLAADANNRIRMCQHCHQIFVAPRSDSRGCKRECNQQIYWASEKGQKVKRKRCEDNGWTFGARKNQQATKPNGHRQSGGGVRVKSVSTRRTKSGAPGQN